MAAPQTLRRPTLDEAKLREARKKDYDEEYEVYFREQTPILERKINRWLLAELRRMPASTPLVMIPAKLERSTIWKDRIRKYFFGRVDPSKVQSGSLSQSVDQTDKRRNGFKQDIETILFAQVIETYRDRLTMNNAIVSDLVSGTSLTSNTATLTKTAVEKLKNLQIAGKKFPEFVKRLSNLGFNDIQDRIQESLARGIVQGESIDQLGRRIRPIVKEVTDKTMARLIPKAKQIARDFVTEAYAVADVDYFKRQNFVTGMMCRETLDKRTCLICGSSRRDGAIKNRPEFITNPWVMAHSRCRFFQEAVFSNQAATELKRVKNVDADNTVEDIDPSNAYQKFFEKQNDAGKLKILGPGRFNLFKKNDLKIDNFTFRSGPRKGQIKTLASLKKSIVRAKK